MKKVSLIGDSIRMSYQAHVTEALADVAEVWAPEGNCMHSIHHLFSLNWYVNQPADVIHFNFGLWDCRRLARDRQENIVPVELFARNLDFLIGKVRGATDAQLIWATITPVVQERYNARFTQPFDPCRVATDVDIYNAAALEIVRSHGLAVNDLHALVTARDPETMINADGVHYEPEHAAILGAQVAEKIRAFL